MTEDLIRESGIFEIGDVGLPETADDEEKIAAIKLAAREIFGEDVDRYFWDLAGAELHKTVPLYPATIELAFFLQTPNWKLMLDNFVVDSLRPGNKYYGNLNPFRQPLLNYQVEAAQVEFNVLDPDVQMHIDRGHLLCQKLDRKFGSCDFRWLQPKYEKVGLARKGIFLKKVADFSKVSDPYFKHYALHFAHKFTCVFGHLEVSKRFIGTIDIGEFSLIHGRTDVAIEFADKLEFITLNQAYIAYATRNTKFIDHIKRRRHQVAELERYPTLDKVDAILRNIFWNISEHDYTLLPADFAGLNLIVNNGLVGLKVLDLVLIGLEFGRHDFIRSVIPMFGIRSYLQTSETPELVALLREDGIEF